MSKIAIVFFLTISIGVTAQTVKSDSVYKFKEPDNGGCGRRHLYDGVGKR